MRYITLLIILVAISCNNRKGALSPTANEPDIKALENITRVSDSINDTWAKHYAFVADLKIYDSLYNSMLAADDLSMVSLIATEVESRFKNTTNTNIQKRYPRLFHDGYYEFIDKNGGKLEDQIECVKIKNLHPNIYKLCLKDATKKLLRSQKVQEAYDLYLNIAQNEELILSEDQLNGYEQIEQYLIEMRKENDANIPQDSFEFNKVFATEKVYTTIWFESEGCYDMGLKQVALSKFISKFPNSTLVDDAAYLLVGMDICGEGGLQNEELIELNKMLKAFLREYPDTNYKERAWSRIIKNITELKGKKAEYFFEIERHLEEFPSSNNADQYRYDLDQIMAVK